MSLYNKFALLALLASTSALAATSATGGSDEVRLRLLSSHQAVQPGQAVQLLLEQTIAPHWHSYWLNPGDSGQATRIDWVLPPGAEAGPIQWPAPQRFSLGPVSNYGYADRVTLISEIRLPADLQAGQSVAIRAQVSWLVCKDICIPQEAELSLALPVAAQSQPAPAAQALLAEARASLPQPAPWPLGLARSGQSWHLTWPAHDGEPAQAEFFAAEWGHVQHSAAQTLGRAGALWRLELPVGEAPPAAGKPITGVLVLGSGAARKAYQVDVPIAATPADTPPELGLWPALLLALAGGLILNLMPCVFPVLSIKALSLLTQAQGQPAQARRHGLAYTGGVLASFAALAALLVALKAAGAEVGWGFQFQSPLFVLVVAWLLFGLGLSLSGLLQIGAGIAGLGSGLADRPGYVGSFFSGVLAAVVATPCTAPFMGAAMAFGLGQPGPVLLAVLLSLGLGLALPYLLLSHWPALQARLPRPGAWMETLKQGFAFPMYGAAIWLVWVLAQQSGPAGVLLSLSGMGLLALAAWLHGVSAAARSSSWRRLGNGAALLSLGLLLGLAGTLQTLTPSTDGQAIEQTEQAAGFEAYSPERLSELRAQGKPVFVNLTAAWCISCLVNEKVALSRPSVRAAFEQRGVHYLKGDWTRKDPRISALLAEHGRSGVPLYLYYPPGRSGAPDILPQLLTTGLVLQALDAGS
jgi:thiol:disulfide interchange protein